MSLLARLFSGLRRFRLAARSLLYRLYLRLAYPGVTCHPSVRFGVGARVRAFGGGQIVIGPGVFVQDQSFVVCEGGLLVLGAHCEVGRHCVICSIESVEIGEGTLLAEHVTIRDQDHAFAGEGRLASKGQVSKPVRIGHDVWLGAKVTVTKGVTIAPHCVVGANGVVTRDLAERGVYAGIPARALSTSAKPSR